MFAFPRAARWLLFTLLLLLIPIFARTGHSTNHLKTGCPQFSAENHAFCLAMDGEVSAVLVELQSAPTAIFSSMTEEITGERPSFAEITDYAIELAAEQDAFVADLQKRGIPAMMRRETVTQLADVQRDVEFRFTYLRNGLVLFVPTDKIADLEAHPSVSLVEVFEPVSMMLDQAIDYSLGTQTAIVDRRAAVYGATEELTPAGDIGHPEAPDMTTDDGVEGQGMILAVIDTGTDFRHPTFGGTGQGTLLPRLSGAPANATLDNQKVIYWFAFSNDPFQYIDDYGHGTHVAADAAGYMVNGDTPAYAGFGTGYDNLGAGPTPQGVQMHGTAPQAQIMVYKVCNIAGNCPGNTELSIEDAASPYTLAAGGVPTAFAKPVADVINLSLGSSAGDSNSATSVASNNAALMGTIVVASAGNSGPGAGTIGAPSAATMAISVGASLDPGSVAGADVLAAGEVADDRTDDEAGPAPEIGASSEANAIATGEQAGMKLFPVAGGGAIPEGSVSAHMVYVDVRDNPADVPPEVTNRIALVEFSGAFAAAANAVAPSNPAAILLVTATESATAVAVAGEIPTFTINPLNAEYLKQNFFDSYTAGIDGAFGTVTAGDISTNPMRAGTGVSLPAYEPAMAGFSSRGPNDHADAGYRVVKPDVTAPGVGIYAPATVDGNVNGMADPTGYTSANGTSFSGPITAGAMILIRQHVRDYLGFDAVVPAGEDYTAAIHDARFEAMTLSRALLMNNATNLRSGLGVPESDANSVASVNDQGAGHIEIAGAISADVVMLSPTPLLDSEYTASAGVAPAGGDFDVLLPSASFANVTIAGIQGTTTVIKEVTLRDIITANATGIDAGRNGAGTYDLSAADNRNLVSTNTQVSFTSDAAGNNPITSVTVPEDGTATFYVKVVADGSQIPLAGTEVMWYVYATQQGSGKAVRMPFYFRAIQPETLILDAPVQNDISNTESTTATLPLDENGAFTLNWTHDVPDGTHATPVGYRIEHATFEEQIFFDDANALLVNGANDDWSGSPQWTTSVNPDSGDNAYFVPSAVEQNEALAMTAPVSLPAGGAVLSFDSNISIENGFDFGQVQASADNANFTTLLTLDADEIGRKSVDIGSFAGGDVWIRFVLITDLLPGATTSETGWYVENIEISANNFEFVKNVDTTEVRATTHATDIMQNGNGEQHLYRIAALYEPIDTTLNGTIIGPFSNVKALHIDTGVPTQIGLVQTGIVANSGLWVALLVAVLVSVTLIATRRRDAA